MFIETIEVIKMKRSFFFEFQVFCFGTTLSRSIILLFEGWNMSRCQVVLCSPGDKLILGTGGGASWSRMCVYAFSRTSTRAHLTRRSAGSRAAKRFPLIRWRAAAIGRDQTAQNVICDLCICVTTRQMSINQRPTSRWLRIWRS